MEREQGFKYTKKEEAYERKLHFNKLAQIRDHHLNHVKLSNQTDDNEAYGVYPPHINDVEETIEFVRKDTMKVADKAKARALN